MNKKDKKTEFVKIRLSKEEKELLKFKVEKLCLNSLSEYLRHFIINY